MLQKQLAKFIAITHVQMQSITMRVLTHNCISQLKWSCHEMGHDIHHNIRTDIFHEIKRD
jgi:hypothetical protein